MEDVKESIKTVAVDHFNRDGYYGTTIRHIAGDVGCSAFLFWQLLFQKRIFFAPIGKVFTIGVPVMSIHSKTSLQ